MSLNPTADQFPQSKSIAGSRDALNVTDMVRAGLMPLASLKLTVFLLVAGVLVTWIATLDQASIDIWELKKKHFESWLVYVPFQTFFVPAWFPKMQDVPGGFYIPSGVTLIFAMLINLSAAHLLRFRLQARGGRLIGGIVMALVTVFATWAIVFNNVGDDGMQVDPPFSYETIWMWMQIAVLGLGVAAMVTAWRMGSERNIERWTLGMLGLIGVGSLGFTLYLGDKAFIGESAMRIMWQLTQSTIVALLGLIACLLLFRRKAGIVLLHLGIAGLLVNEVYVTTTNREQEMLIEEGKSASVAVDSRYSELAIILREGEEDTIVTVPGSLLAESARRGTTIENEQLPFGIECLDYMVNTEFENFSAGANPATHGVGKQVVITERAPVPGTETRDRNYPGAYVRLLDKDTRQEMGVYMVSLIGYQNGIVDSIQRDGKEYFFGLRDKEIYKDYTITLEDVRRENYIGTDTPRWYSSDIILKDSKKDISHTQQVWMNNPMRYGGETFYQKSFIPGMQDFRERTVLQIVTNHGWMIPYVCCMFVVVGLTHQFGNTLLGHLKRTQQRTDTVRVNGPDQGVESAGGRRGSLTRAQWIVATSIIAVFALYAAGKLSRAARAPAIASGEMRMDLFGKIPVTHEGRVKPLDSVARNLARQLCNREVVDYKTSVTQPRMFGLYRSNEKRPAIQWLADTIFETEGHDVDYEILRVEDPNVQRALGLPRRKSMDYTWQELMNGRQQLQQLLDEALEQEEESWNVFQKRIGEVARKISKINGVKASLSSPEYWPETSVVERLERGQRFAAAEEVPLMYPTGNEDRPWESYSTVVNRQWLDGIAAEYGERNPAKLAQLINDKEVIEPARVQMLQDAMKLELIKQGKKKSEVDTMLSENGGVLPKEVFLELLPQVAPTIDQRIQERRMAVDAMTFAQVRDINGADKKTVQFEDEGLLAGLSDIEAAYRRQDADAFNAAVEDYLAQVNEVQPTGLDPSTIKLESMYNVFSPFYMSMVMYLVAFVLCIFGWVGWGRMFNRAVFGVITIGLLIQFGAIVARIMISGRPPVTNLYSSFIFVSAVAVLVMLAVEWFTRLGVGNLMASLAGFLALMAAWSISLRDGDTFTVLQAVLDTQFWLSTHVVCISLGYTATVAAGFLGIAFVVGGICTRLFDDRMRKLFGNAIYGIVCFGLLFSFFGTVLGGLWADDSWGRFWGWDPKENGALMIVLWNAVVLHARWAGIVKLRGVAILAILGNVVTIWSWEAVNQLGIGLHTYGFTEGRMKYIVAFWLANFAIAGVGLIPTRWWRSFVVEQKS